MRSLRTGVTIGAPQDVIAAATVLGAASICNVYGQTESYGNCCVTPHDWPLERRAACQGPPLPGVEIRIVDAASGAALPDGEEGLIEVRGYVTRGYVGSSASQTADAITPDGFFRTGDMGRMLADGSIAFSGRITEMIKKSGINISPAEVEDVLMRHDDVALACAVGVPDALQGVMIFEMTRDYTVIVPLMIANMVSFVISRVLQPEPIYGGAVALQEGVHLPTSESRAGVQCAGGDIMDRDAKPIPPDADIGRLNRFLDDSQCQFMAGGRGALCERCGQRPSGRIRGPYPYAADLIKGRGGLSPRTYGSSGELRARPYARRRNRLAPVVSRADIHELQGVVTLAAHSGQLWRHG